MMRILPIIVILSLLALPVYGAPEVKLFNYSTYLNSSGAPVIVGEVINDSKESIKSVEVEASFIDSSGEILDSGSAFVAIDLIPPRQRAPFMIVGAAEYTLSVKSFEVKVVNFDKGQTKPAKLEIISTSVFSDGISEVSISGEIQNAGDTTVTMSKIYATFYDDSSKVVGFASVNTEPDSLAPDVKANFKLKVHERISSIRSYTLYAESEQFSTKPYGVRSIGHPIDIGTTVGVSRLVLLDQQGNEMGKFAPNERTWIKSDLKNRLSIQQDFTYIVQIKDKDGLPVELKWIEGVLDQNMSLSPSVSWTPEDEGIYFAEIFVWHSFDNPIPLSTSIKTIILFVQA